MHINIYIAHTRAHTLLHLNHTMLTNNFNEITLIARLCMRIEVKKFQQQIYINPEINVDTYLAWWYILILFKREWSTWKLFITHQCLIKLHKSSSLSSYYLWPMCVYVKKSTSKAFFMGIKIEFLLQFFFIQFICFDVSFYYFFHLLQFES